MRILLVSQMYPGPEAPDYGVFVRDLADAVERRGHEIERVVIDRRGAGLGKYVSLAPGVPAPRPARTWSGATSCFRQGSPRSPGARRCS